MTASLTSTPLTQPGTSAAEQSRMELQAKLNGLGGLNGPKHNPEAKAKKLREACEGFESIFIQKMWQEMRNAVPKTGMLIGREERFWQDMYDQELSKSMTKAGGIGLADMMYEQLSRNLVSASRSAAGLSQGAAFVPTAAPLLGQAEPAESLLPEDKLDASIYDGEASGVGQVAGAETPARPEPQVAQPSVQPEKIVAEMPQPEKTAAQAEQAITPPPVAPLKPENAPQASVSQPVQAEPDKAHRKVHKADLGQASGLQMAQKAHREAGDKLGSNAVRPAQRPQRQTRARQQQEASEQAQATGLSQTGNLQPGSAEALRAAMETAKAGASENISQPINLNQLVANAQALNLNQTAAPAQAEASAPVTRKVRFSTNRPKQAADASKKTKQAIRTLNVDNVGINSKQGKGLAAYHAQQEAAMAAQPAPQPTPAQPVAPLVPEAAPQTPIPPLTPQNQSASVDSGANSAIAPLRAS